MCNRWCNDFVKRCSDEWNKPDSILEVGSFNVNGSPRDVLKATHTGEYIGVDIQEGPGVDQVVSTYNLSSVFGDERFDVVISTEMLEHVEHWREALYQMASVLKPGGKLLVTTRSPGFEWHPYPLDCWRFTLELFQKIFVWPMHPMCMETDPDLRNGVYSGVGVLAVRAGDDMWGWYQHLKTLEAVRP